MKQFYVRRSLRLLRRCILGKIHQSHFVVALCIGVIIGAIITVTTRLDFFISPLWIAVATFSMLLVYFSPRAFLLPLALVAGLLLSFHKGALELAGEDYISSLHNQTITVHGHLSTDPDTDESKTKFKLTNLTFGEIDQGSESSYRGSHASFGQIYVSMSKNPDLARGDEVTLSGILYPGFGTYVGFLSRPQIVHWARPSPPEPTLAVRNWFADRIKNLIDSPEQNLGLSYLLGMRSGLPEDLDTNLRTVGLVHIVVASGAHLSILVEIARKIFSKISRSASVFMSILFILFFMSMVGWTPSIMRAGIMSILTILAWRTGHKFAAWRIILLVAAFTLLINPMFLIDLGWLLSFASFSGIMLLGPALIKFFYPKKPPGFIASTILTTVAATLMTFPITLYFFGTLSLISILPGLLILPTLPYAMGLVFLSGLMYQVPVLDSVTSFLATKLLNFHIIVVDFFGQMKSFMIEIPPEQPQIFYLYIIVLAPFLMAFVYRRFKIYRRRLAFYFLHEKC